MQAKNNRLNTDFQILYFIVGSCHTPDAAYALLLDLRDDRQMALNTAKVSELKRRADVINAKKMLLSENEAERVMAEATLVEIELGEEIYQKNLKAAQKELDFIDFCIEKLQPYRKFGHLTDEEAHRLCQQEEWKYELISRAENLLMTGNGISADDFKTMRMHPEFTSEIYPRIRAIKNTIESGNLEALLLSKNEFRKPLMAFTEDCITIAKLAGPVDKKELTRALD